MRETISKEEVNELPLVFFEGEIIVVDTEKKAKEAIKVLRKQKIVGIDTETKPSLKRDNPIKLPCYKSPQQINVFYSD